MDAQTAIGADIERLIPHRPPFRYVDELVHVKDGRGEFLLRLALEDPRLWQGKLPPLLLVEALAQCAAAFHGASSSGRAESGVLVQIDKAILRREARAGDEVSLTVRRTHALGKLVRFSGAAHIDGEAVVEAQFTVARSEAA